MSHHCIDWLPKEFFYKANILWTLDLEWGYYEAKPTIWVEHGIPDNHVVTRKQFFDDVHYLCSNDWSYENLKEAGMQAYHVGSVFLDYTIPKKRDPRLFVYCPQHTLMENHGFDPKYNHKPKTREELESLTKEYGCEDFVTSIVDDTDRALYLGLNEIHSNRYFNSGFDHFEKCRYLYENAKVVYTDLMSTFDITAEAHGIEVIGRDSQKTYRTYDNIGVLTDGKCRDRILEVIDGIIRGC